MTTNVQFFESLFAHKPSACRKLHRIARSAVIFDEAQALPANLLAPCLEAMKTLRRDYGCTLVLCTATQPALGELKHPLMLSENCDIVPDYHDIFAKLKRVNCDVSRCLHGAMTIPELAGFVSELSDKCRSTLVVMNTKPGAVGLYNELRGRRQGGGRD